MILFRRETHHRPLPLNYQQILLLAWACSTSARPEPPSSYFPPSGGGGGGGGYPSGIGGTGNGGSYGPPAAPPASSYGPPQRQPVIHKHVYVHVPPPEAPEYKAPKYVAPAPPPQKHYKIVFIKAPTPPTPTAPSLPALPPQDEEKTLIYVLVKKPEEAPEIVLPTQAPTQPSKPEVYFIRYKTQVCQYYASIRLRFKFPIKWELCKRDIDGKILLQLCSLAN